MCIYIYIRRLQGSKYPNGFGDLTLGPSGEVLLCSWSLPGSTGMQWHNYRGGRNETYASFAAAKAPKALAELDTSKTGALSDTEFMQSVDLRSWHLEMVFPKSPRCLDGYGRSPPASLGHLQQGGGAGAWLKSTFPCGMGFGLRSSTP